MPSLRQLDGRVHDEAFRACVFWRERHRVLFFFGRANARETRFPSPLLSLSLPTSQPQVRVEECDTEAAVAAAWGGGGAGAAWPHFGRGEKAQLSVSRPAGRPRALLPPSPHTHFLSAWGGSLTRARHTAHTRTHHATRQSARPTQEPAGTVRECQRGEEGGRSEDADTHACRNLSRLLSPPRAPPPSSPTLPPRAGAPGRARPIEERSRPGPRIHALSSSFTPPVLQRRVCRARPGRRHRRAARPLRVRPRHCAAR